MSRRGLAFALITLTAGAFFSEITDAQQATPRRIGVLLVGFSPESKEAQAFKQGLRES